MAGLYGLENMDVIRVKVKTAPPRLQTSTMAALTSILDHHKYLTIWFLAKSQPFTKYHLFNPADKQTAKTISLAEKCDGLMQPEHTKFSIDPQITSYDMLQTILASAFNIKGDFAISYLAKDEWKQDVYLSMLSDWDLDAACQSAATPHLKLKVDLKPFEEGLDDWDIIAPVDIPQPKISHLIDRNSFLSSITGTITTRVERTVNQMQKAMKLRPDDGIMFSVKPPMSDMEFRNYQDSNGSLVKPHELRLSIYQGGLETSLRRVVWRHILNIYPEHLSGRERFDYMKKKELEYYKLRDQWKTHFSTGTASEDVKYIASMVKKDVLRTDRTHKFYAGSDENKNVVALFHILVTYALTHPEVSYCQGMSDIASPLLVTQKDEAQAYLCFCGSMKRLKSNFMINGVAMTTKFQHLTLLLQICDPVFYAYLKDCDAHDLFFCYRWLLLELKREFPLDDSLLMLETMWSTLPPDPPEMELHLMDPDYVPYSLSNYPSSLSPSFKQTVYAKLMAMRRNMPPKSLSFKIQQEKRQINNHNSVNNNSQPSPCDNSPSDDKINSQEYPKFDVADALKLTARSQSIDISLGQNSSEGTSKGGYSCSESDLRDDEVRENDDCSSRFDESNGRFSCSNVHYNEAIKEPEEHSQFYISLELPKPESNVVKEEIPHEGGYSSFFKGVKRLLSSPKRKAASPMNIAPRTDREKTEVLNDRNKQETSRSAKNLEGMLSIGKQPYSPQISDCDDIFKHSPAEIIDETSGLRRLPGPHEFGSGNPFLLFLCVTLFLQHRDHIMRNQMDYDELAMYFDRMVRKHNVHKVLQQARQLYSDYLRDQQQLQIDRESYGLSV